MNSNQAEKVLRASSTVLLTGDVAVSVSRSFELLASAAKLDTRGVSDERELRAAAAAVADSAYIVVVGSPEPTDAERAVISELRDHQLNVPGSVKATSAKVVVIVPQANNAWRAMIPTVLSNQNL